MPNEPDHLNEKSPDEPPGQPDSFAEAAKPAFAEDLGCGHPEGEKVLVPAATPAALEEEQAPTPAPWRRFDRVPPPLSWWRKLMPAAGLALFLGCLWSLLDAGWPGLPFWWNGQSSSGNLTVVIDPGHGGGDSGAVAQGVVEKDLNLDVGLRIARNLRARGVAVRLTREDDRFVPLEGRVRFANALPGSVFVSIHFNDASGDGQATGRASGIETYYCEHKLAPGTSWTLASLLGREKKTVPDAAWAIGEGRMLADGIQGALIAGTRAENRGTKERSLYVTHRVAGPAVLVEGGFVSHPGEARRLADPAYRQTLANCISDGIAKYLRNTRTIPSPALASSTAPKQG